jgi:CheY-like chemotaxis protein/two-component sensor histidine kinase
MLKKYSEIIIERGWQLTSIINDILTISSLETQQEQLFNESFNVNELLKNQIAVFSEQAQSKGIQLVINKLLSEEESEIYTDKNKLGQILNNLFTNAFKFTQQGEIELGCTLSGNMLQFFVRDTGIGIEKSKQELIFERFAQADDLIRRDYGGTGLGLSICKGFVELMGGKIWIESEPNQGSTFHFMIPFHKNIINNVTKNMEQEINGTDKMITVLVAEDDEINFSYLKIVLKKLNVNVIRAENGQEAVDFCKTELIDIILMDIKMPVMNGYTAAKLIKEFKPNLPIIAQSAHAVQAEIEEYRDAFDDYITKPIKIFNFKEILQKYIK